MARQCNKCDNILPNIIKVEGKWHNIKNRRYCLDCSPFKQHNTRKVELLTNGELILKERCCSICKETKTIDNFYVSIRSDSGHIKYHSYCIPCTSKDTNSRAQEQKKRAVEYKGGRCERCGYNKSITAFDFHHIDPSKKDFEIARAKRYSFERIKPELDKCLLLCANCHREEHERLHLKN